MKETHIWVMDREGNVVRETKAATLPAANRRRAGKGTGHPAYRLRNGAHGDDALSRSSSIGPTHRVHREPARPPGTEVPRDPHDRNDARGLAHLARTGFYKCVHVKSRPAHAIRALIIARRSW